MKIIISPAKKMNVNNELLEAQHMPQYIDKTKNIVRELKSKSKEELKALWKCNDKIADQNYERLQQMNLCEHLTPAILAYEGIQYQYMAPTVFEKDMLNYVQQHLRILSGFYGVLKPMDGVTSYRLEMQAKLEMETNQNLYEFWGSRLYDGLLEGNEAEVIINLASKEYSKCIERYLRPADTYVTCVFGELVNEKVVQKGTYAKMARGEMVRYMAEHQIENVEEVKKFCGLGYCFSEGLSTDETYVFLKS